MWEAIAWIVGIAGIGALLALLIMAYIFSKPPEQRP